MTQYKDKTVIQTYLANETYAKLKKLADNDKRSLSSFVRILLEDYVSKHSEGANNADV